MSRQIRGSVVVLTGASSGIARAAAAAFAREGANVVLAARSEDSLRETAAECESAGGKALVVPADVTDEAAVADLARRANDTFGRIDVWVNAAAVILYGEFEDTPSDAYRQVIETNLFGQIHGARAVLPYFRAQRSGVLVNIASVWGSVTSPYVSSYVVSKFGVRAFAECLQEGLRLERGTHDIHVCTILPQSVDTPIFRHAGNYTPRKPRPVPPVVDPDRVVRAILRSVRHPRRQRTVAWSGRALELGHALLPTFYSRLVPKVMNAASFTQDDAAPGPGNIFEPAPSTNAVRGGWRRNKRAPAVTAAIAGAAAAAAAAGWHRLRST
jgi:NAD(P)-dependent dehydrogenase (short-subunit alcohol dehydrogenase family)